MHSAVRIWEKSIKQHAPMLQIGVDGNGAWMGGAHGTWGHVVGNIAVKLAMFRGSPTRASKLTPGCPQNLRSIYDIGWVVAPFTTCCCKWHLESTSHSGLFWAPVSCGGLLCPRQPWSLVLTLQVTRGLQHGSDERNRTWVHYGTDQNTQGTGQKPPREDSISADKWRQVKNGPHRPRWVLEYMFLSFRKAVEFRDLFPMKCSLRCPQCVPPLLLICSLFYFIFFAKCSISYSHSSHVSFTCVS